MGCDIHLYGEVKKTPTSDWTAYGIWGADDYGQWNQISAPIYSSRNYALFSTLADVRNYDDLPIIAPAKGLPPGLSPEVARMAEQWEGDGHSYSYFTLKELLAFDWYQSVLHTGLVPWPVYVLWKTRHPWEAEEGPTSWARATTCPTITQEDADARFAALPRTQKEALREEATEDPLNLLTSNHPFVDAVWETPLLTSAQDFLGRIMGILGSQAPDGDLSRVRIVFWFDN
jgi:hypothetical protein